MRLARGTRPQLYSHDGVVSIEEVVIGEIGRHLDDDPGDSEVDSLSWRTTRSELHLNDVLTIIDLAVQK